MHCSLIIVRGNMTKPLSRYYLQFYEMQHCCGGTTNNKQYLQTRRHTEDRSTLSPPPAVVLPVSPGCRSWWAALQWSHYRPEQSTASSLSLISIIIAPSRPGPWATVIKGRIDNILIVFPRIEDRGYSEAGLQCSAGCSHGICCDICPQHDTTQLKRSLHSP